MNNSQLIMNNSQLIINNEGERRRQGELFIAYCLFPIT
jgi:hypothetical protein